LHGFQVDEYPYEALREALINAVAHRDYALRGSSIRVEKFANRIVILSPGIPPPPLTLAKIRSLKYLPCSRNPNIARGLSFFERIEEQGDGFRRMMTVTRNLGLPEPDFQITDGHFVTFRGPGKSLSKVKPQIARPLFEVEPSTLDRLTANQKTIMRELLKAKAVQVRKLAEKLEVTEQAVRKDMAKLTELQLVEQRGGSAGHVLRPKAAISRDMNPQLSATAAPRIRNWPRRIALKEIRNQSATGADSIRYHR
jgi:predicted HTH transcriptional regulator